MVKGKAICYFAEALAKPDRLETNVDCDEAGLGNTLVAVSPLIAVGSVSAQPTPTAPIGFAGAQGIPAGNYNISKRSAADLALPNPYLRDETFFKWPADRELGAISAIEMDRDGKSIWVSERCSGQYNCIDKHMPTIVKFGADGRVLTQFGADMIVYPHGIAVDRQGNVWTAEHDRRRMIQAPGGALLAIAAGTAPAIAAPPQVDTYDTLPDGRGR